MLTNSRATEPPRLLSVEALAEYLDVPVQTVYRWNARGNGPRYVKIGKHARYRSEDVAAWLDAHDAS